MKKGIGLKKVIHRIMAAAAAIVILFFVSFESAKAFRWTFLLKLLTPVAETFDIYSASFFDSEGTVNDPDALISDDTEYEQLSYASPEQMPSEMAGYRTIPAWTPEGFAFVQGTTYEDPDMAHSSLFYQNDDDFLSVELYIYQNDEAVFSYDYERTLPEPRSEDINGIAVSFYQNDDGEITAASWINGAAHYHVHGNISVEEMKQIVGSLME